MVVVQHHCELLVRLQLAASIADAMQEQAYPEGRQHAVTWNAVLPACAFCLLWLRSGLQQMLSNHAAVLQATALHTSSPV